uniref:Aspartyl/glutamyl-tRNA(Asn/Gln) amidotransferase subunit B n=1 Tax=candidate division WOR-3 bacterium TaxID=2052148 RepID=A0A7C6E9K3_UNCW3
MEFEPIIGVEVHCQLKTESKLFCSCPVEYGAPPNSLVCPVCLGLPGVLPVLNNRAVELAIRLGLATNCSITEYSRFARKHYFYPDLPKGYQITQYQEPLAHSGYLIVNGEKIRIKRIILEEDSGKSMHCGNETLIDFNRCGIPLIEIVTEPDIRSPRQAVEYLRHLRLILQYLEVSDADMEKGHFRCEPNISVRRKGASIGTRTELKNLNSLRNVRDALEYEIKRQSEILSKGGEVRQETLYWDETKMVTGPMRSKEESEDYRYFPEPDLPPLLITQEEIARIKKELPILPEKRKQYFIQKLGLKPADAEILISEKSLADYYEECLKHIPDMPQPLANWIITEIFGILNEKKITINELGIKPPSIAKLLSMVRNGEITGKVAKEVFTVMVKTKDEPDKIVAELGVGIVDDENLLNSIVDEVLKTNLEVVEKYKRGKTTVISFLVGEVMKKTKGKFLPQKVNKIILQKLQG